MTDPNRAGDPPDSACDEVSMLREAIERDTFALLRTNMRQVDPFRAALLRRLERGELPGMLPRPQRPDRRFCTARQAGWFLAHPYSLRRATLSVDVASGPSGSAVALFRTEGRTITLLAYGAFADIERMRLPAPEFRLAREAWRRAKRQACR